MRLELLFEKLISPIARRLPHNLHYAELSSALVAQKFQPAFDTELARALANAK